MSEMYNTKPEHRNPQRALNPTPKQRTQWARFQLLGTVTGLPGFLNNALTTLARSNQSTLHFERLCEEMKTELKRIEQNIRSSK